MIKFLLMCCLMVCGVMASEMEWVEAEIVGRRLRMKCTTREELIDFERDVFCLEQSQPVILPNGSVWGIDEEALTRIERVLKENNIECEREIKHLTANYECFGPNVSANLFFRSSLEAHKGNLHSKGERLMKHLKEFLR